MINVINPWATQDSLKKLDEPKSETETIWKAWKAEPDNIENKRKLLNSLNSTIESALTTYGGKHKAAYVTQANLMALRAAETYDPKQQVKLTSHVFNNLKSLNRLKGDREYVLKVPENVKLEQNKLYKAEQDLHSELGRPPSLSELADATGISGRRIEKVRKYKNVYSESETTNETGDSLFHRKQDPMRVWSEYVYNELDDYDKKIYEWSTGYGGEKQLSKREIAARLKITPAAVSQRIGKIIGKLETGMAM